MRTTMPLLALILQLLLFATSCKQSTEPKLEAELKLELEDVSCTEAWIKLTTTNLQLPATINLLKDGNLSETISLLSADTLLYVDSLLPNQTYKFQTISHSFIQPFNHSGLSAEGRHSSNELTVTTMDTTSHNFTWQSWEFGQHSSSTLYDVAIIDENNIWAVGEIYMRDSLGRCDPNAYNAVHWNGSEWKLMRIKTYSSCDPVDYSSILSVIAFDTNNIIFMTGGSIIKYNGITYTIDCTIRPLLTGRLNKLWGSSSNDLYAVGNNGNIAHWDGVKWRKIESPTTLNINDIWGDFNSKTDHWEVLAVCGNILHGWENEREILRINLSQSEKINSFGSKWPLSGLWFKTNKQYYVIGSGIYENKRLGQNWTGEPLDITTYFIRRIRANQTNDIIVVGDFGEVLHFNGYSWKSFISQTYLPGGTYLSVSVKDNFFTAVGYDSRKAVILIGRR
ncbi:MAG: glucosyl transferase [Ignavibacterium sp.]|jgi:hypothetical protein